MKRRERRFQIGIINHCYQRSVDGGVIFYCYSDYLVWFTTVCVIAGRYSVQIIAMSPMPDHAHFTILASSRKDLEGFMGEYSKRFAKVHNKVCHRTGPLFESPFGSAPKYGAKKARTNIAYVWNNPVERQLAEKAEDYRWTFLAYATTDHPFSKKLIIRNARWPIRKAVKEIKAQYKQGKPLSYCQLQRLYHPLDPEEKQQLTDYIISTYNVIDYKAASRFFGGYEEMLLALHANTGSEYDLNEVFVGKSDAHYAKMVSVIMREMKLDDIHDILAMDIDTKYAMFLLLRKNTDAMAEQIAAFLHLPLSKKK